MIKSPESFHDAYYTPRHHSVDQCSSKIVLQIAVGAVRCSAMLRFSHRISLHRAVIKQQTCRQAQEPGRLTTHRRQGCRMSLSTHLMSVTFSRKTDWNMEDRQCWQAPGPSGKGWENQRLLSGLTWCESFHGFDATSEGLNPPGYWIAPQTVQVSELGKISLKNRERGCPRFLAGLDWE